MKYVYILLLSFAVILVGCGQNFDFESNAYDEDNMIDENASDSEGNLEVMEVELLSGAMSIEMKEVEIVANLGSDIASRTEYIVEYADGTKVAEEGALPYLENASISQVFVSDDAVLLRYKDISIDEEFDIVLHKTTPTLLENITYFIYNYRDNYRNASVTAQSMAEQIRANGMLISDDENAFGYFKDTKLEGYEWGFISSSDTYEDYDIASSIMLNGTYKTAQYYLWKSSMNYVIDAFESDGKEFHATRQDGRYTYYTLDPIYIRKYNDYDYDEDGMNSYADTRFFIDEVLADGEFSLEEMDALMLSVAMNVRVDRTNKRLVRWRQNPQQMLQEMDGNTKVIDPLNMWIKINDRNRDDYDYLSMEVGLHPSYLRSGFFYDNLSLTVSPVYEAYNLSSNCQFTFDKVEPDTSSQYQYIYYKRSGLSDDCRVFIDNMLGASSSGYSSTSVMVNVSTKDGSYNSRKSIKIYR